MYQQSLHWIVDIQQNWNNTKLLLLNLFTNEIFQVHIHGVNPIASLSEYINMTNYNCAKCQNCS